MSAGPVDTTPKVWMPSTSGMMVPVTRAANRRGSKPVGRRDPERHRRSADLTFDRLSVEFVPVTYDHRALALEMRSEDLPEEFVQTILTGWWTTCLEILPGKERAQGRF